MRHLTRLFACCTAVLAAASSSADELITAGRVVDPEKSFSVRLSAGRFQDIAGEVRETASQIAGNPSYEFNGENYSLQDLGLEESDLTLGLGLEKQWRYITLRGEFSYLHAEATARAPDDLLLGVDSFTYNGQTYNYQQILQDMRYDAELDGGVVSLRLQFTPFTIAPDNIVSFTPWVHAGVYALGGSYSVDAGEIQGVELPGEARGYVVGGDSEGEAGIVTPELGFGGQLLVFLGEGEHGLIELALQGTYAIFTYDGSGSLGFSSSGNNDDLDIDYDVLELRAEVNIPLGEHTDLLLGAEYRLMTAEASGATVENAFGGTFDVDKSVDFELTQISIFAGLRF